MSTANYKYQNESDVQDGQFKRLLAKLGLSSLMLSIILHVIFGITATVLVVAVFQKKHVNFQASEDPGPPQQEVEHKVELTKRNNVESAPPDLKRIVTTSLSPINLPDVPEIPQDTELTPTSMSGADGVMGQGMTSGSGTGGNGAGSSFGQALTDGVTPALVGSFYDLKQTSDDPPQPSKISREGWRTVMLQLIDGSMNEDILKPYFKSPDQRSSNGFAIPQQASENAPKAFGLEGKVKPNLWCIIYHTKAIAPDSGRYRFVGFGDDMLVVKKDGAYVFDGGWQFMTKREDLHQTYPNIWAKTAGVSGRLRQGDLV